MKAAPPRMPIPQEVAEGHPAAPVSQKRPAEQGGHGHIVTHAHPGPHMTTARTARAWHGNPTGSCALQAPRHRPQWGSIHLCLFCDLGQLTLSIWASVLHMETELAIALSSMRAERGYVCENCARCPAGGMCQFFSSPLPPCLPPPALPSGHPQHYSCCLPCTPFKAASLSPRNSMSLLCAHLHPSG